MFTVRHLAVAISLLACTSCAAEVRFRPPSSAPATPDDAPALEVGAVEPPFTLEAEELPGTWVQTFERRMSDAQLTRPSLQCGSDRDGHLDDLTGGWQGSFALEPIDGGSASGFVDVTTGRWKHPQGPEVEYANYDDIGYPSCLGRRRADDFGRVADQGTVTIRPSVQDLPGLGADSAVRAAWFRTTFGSPESPDRLIVDTVYLLTAQARVRLVLNTGSSDSVLLLRTVLPIVIARLQGGAAVPLASTSSLSRPAAQVTKLPGSTDDMRLTAADVIDFAAGSAPSELNADCPSISTEAMATAAPALWERWKPDLVAATPLRDGIGVETSMIGLLCRWDRTELTAGVLYVTVLWAPNTFATDPAGEIADGGYEENGSTWGATWCNVRDEQNVLIRIVGEHSMIPADEMWQICDAAVPMVRRAVLAG